MKKTEIHFKLYVLPVVLNITSLSIIDQVESNKFKTRFHIPKTCKLSAIIHNLFHITASTRYGLLTATSSSPFLFLDTWQNPSMFLEGTYILHMRTYPAL